MGSVECPDEASVRQAQRGDPIARRALASYLYPIVHKHIGFTLGFVQGYEDAVQDALCAILMALPRLREPAAVRGWALAIATRTAYRALGRRRRDACADELPADYEAGSSDRELSLALAQALSRLKPKKRQAFVLMEVLELTAEEAGEALGVPANTAASRARHARDELRAFLE